MANLSFLSEVKSFILTSSEEDILYKVAKKERGNAKGQFPKNAARVFGGCDGRGCFQSFEAGDYRLCGRSIDEFQSCVDDIVVSCMMLL